MNNLATQAQTQYPAFATEAVIRKLAEELLDAAGVKKEDTNAYKEQRRKYYELLEHYYVTEFSALGADYENPFQAFAETVSKRILKMREP